MSRNTAERDQWTGSGMSIDLLTAGIDAAQSGRAYGGGDLIPEMRALIASLG